MLVKVSDSGLLKMSDTELSVPQIAGHKYASNTRVMMCSMPAAPLGRPSGKSTEIQKGENDDANLQENLPSSKCRV